MQKINIIAGGMNRVFRNMSKYMTPTLSAFRDFSYDYGTRDNIPTLESLPGKETDFPATLHENMLRNELLEKEIKKSGLGYHKCAGGYREEHSSSKITEYSFIVYNTRFLDNDFLKLMLHLGTLFSQDTILVTRPSKENKARQLANVTADYYITNPKIGTVGTKKEHFENLTMSNLTQFFTRMYGNSFSFISEMELYRPQGSFAMHSMYLDFYREYPNLCDGVRK